MENNKHRKILESQQMVKIAIWNTRNHNCPLTFLYCNFSSYKKSCL